uniref:Uncharacterized protein n=1 Tax=Anguilla anguilla TaxID=7936 RepID=A0A0E9W374_ANGAN
MMISLHEFSHTSFKSTNLKSRLFQS